MKITSTLLLTLILQLAFGQAKQDQFFLMDMDWKPTKIKKAIYYLRVRQTNDSNFEWTYYLLYGPRIKKESFKDEKATIRNGKYAYYYGDGTIDSSGEYVNGKLNGTWYYRDRHGMINRQKNYIEGVKVKDTVIVQREDKGGSPQLRPGEIESEYPGGSQAWIQYLNKNLHYPDRAVNAEVMGEVRLQFIVDKDGNIVDPDINKSVEYSLDEEALRIIGGSIKWTPAFQDGRNVKSYKIQPIRFRLTR